MGVIINYLNNNTNICDPSPMTAVHSKHWTISELRGRAQNLANVLSFFFKVMSKPSSSNVYKTFDQC